MRRKIGEKNLWNKVYFIYISFIMECDYNDLLECGSTYKKWKKVNKILNCRHSEMANCEYYFCLLRSLFNFILYEIESQNLILDR